MSVETLAGIRGARRFCHQPSSRPEYQDGPMRCKAISKTRGWGNRECIQRLHRQSLQPEVARTDDYLWKSFGTDRLKWHTGQAAAKMRQ